MNNGFLKIACGIPDIKVADCEYNAKNIIDLIIKSEKEGVKIISFPELSITGATCGGLFFQRTLIDSARENLLKIAKETENLDIISIIGLPFLYEDKLYNCAAVTFGGNVTAIVPKTSINGFEEKYFASADNIKEERSVVEIDGELVSFGAKKVFRHYNNDDFSFGIVMSDNMISSDSLTTKLAENGAKIIFELSAIPELVGRRERIRTMKKAKSMGSICAIASAGAGTGESSTDFAFSGYSLIVENGIILSETKPFSDERLIIADIDTERLISERKRNKEFISSDEFLGEEIYFEIGETKLSRRFSKTPFIPEDKKKLKDRCEEILSIQTAGLVKRLRHIGCKNVVLGLSGGLDSTLALIVSVRAFDTLGLDRKGIKTITMPCFGTTDRTYNNACELAKIYGTSLEEINIKESVSQHFKDISHNPDVHDVTYENSQARERTQVLMDKANQYNAIVVGTGDLSELALGWATYNGDHMSMYGVNGSVPKTLVRHLVSYEAENSEAGDILKDVLDTPVSPELIPAKNGVISQKTEDLVGPYELHDFFIYYFLRFGFSPKKILRMAEIAFAGDYDSEIIKKWLITFIKRFFSQQFKRSCLPDGCKVGSVGVSPRGDLNMPSDAVSALWLKELQ